MKIYFDLDGTIADLYNVPGWLASLNTEDSSPYTRAKPMVNLSQLTRLLHKAQAAGHEIGIISWTSKNGSEEYNEEVREAKCKWLQKHMPSIVWDEIHIIDYGTSKVSCGRTGILFDDDLRVRKEWGHLAYAPSEIMDVLKEILR